MKHLSFLTLLMLGLLITSCAKDPVVGCTDPNAANYNPDAEEDSGNCTYVGCTDPDAANYDPMATEDSGDCIFRGCTDEDADNYDPKHNQEDGSCTYFDLFLGDYDGTFECMGPFADLLDEAASEITKKPGDENSDQITVIVSNPATEITLLLDGVITKDQAIIDTYIQNFEYTLEAGPLVVEGPFEVFVTGTLDRDGDTLSGPIKIRIDKTELSLSVSDDCIYTAIKK